MSLVQLKFKTLIKKLSYTKSDLEYHRAEHERRKIIFHDELNKYLLDTEYSFSVDKASKNMVDIYKKTPAVELPDVKQQTKDIFKKVAKITHPDLDREQKHDNLFIEAKDALEGNDWFAMYQIGTDLGINISGISKEHILWLEQEISMIEQIIKGITDTFEWVYSNDGANKQQLLTTYCMLTCKLKNE